MKILQFLYFYVGGILCCLCFTSCSKVVYKDVYIPTKCNIEMPKKPRFYEPKNLNEYILLLKDTLEYSEKLEKSLQFCTQDNDK